MVPMTRYPTLDAIRRELNDLEASERIEAAARRRETIRVVKGASLHRVEWGGRRYWLTTPQLAVVKVLAEAATGATGATGASPDVDRLTLMRAAGGRASRPLAEVFAGVEGWESLVVAGAKLGSYRLADLGEAGEMTPDAGHTADADEVRVVRDEDEGTPGTWS